MLEVLELYKNFGPTAALSEISLSLDAGIHVVAGANGAGKTTLLRVIAGAERPSSGAVIIDGLNAFENFQQARSRINYLSDKAPLYLDLTVEEHLTYRARLKGLSGRRMRARLRHVMDSLELKDAASLRNSTLSAGVAKRVAIADTLLVDSRLLILDEPYESLDARYVRHVSDILSSMKRHVIIMIATHNLAEAERLTGDCTVLSSGALVGSFCLDDENHTPLVDRVAQTVKDALKKEGEK